jgi:hypothetical protein
MWPPNLIEPLLQLLLPEHHVRRRGDADAVATG